MVDLPDGGEDHIIITNRFTYTGGQVRQQTFSIIETRTLISVAMSSAAPFIGANYFQMSLPSRKSTGLDLTVSILGYSY